MDLTDLPEWLGLIVALGGGAAALRPGLRRLRPGRRLQIVEAPLACPRTGQTVRCELELDPQTEVCEGILRCSAMDVDRRPSCDQACVRVLNLGIPLRSIPPEPRDAQRERGPDEEASDEG